MCRRSPTAPTTSCLSRSTSSQPCPARTAPPVPTPGRARARGIVAVRMARERQGAPEPDPASDAPLRGRPDHPEHLGLGEENVPSRPAARAGARPVAAGLGAAAADRRPRGPSGAPAHPDRAVIEEALNDRAGSSRKPRWSWASPARRSIAAWIRPASFSSGASRYRAERRTTLRTLSADTVAVRGILAGAFQLKSLQAHASRAWHAGCYSQDRTPNKRIQSWTFSRS